MSEDTVQSVEANGAIDFGKRSNRSRKRGRIDKEEIAGTLLAAIPLVGFCIFGLIPLIMALIMAFFNLPGYSFDGATWAGFDNFKYVLTDPNFGKAIGNTLILGTSVLISQVLALVIAYFLNKDIKGRKAFRMIYFIPYVCSVVAVTLMWKYMFNTNFGIINQMIGKTGDDAIDWLGNPPFFITAVIIMSVWSGMGWGIIIYTAALTNVNRSMVEAAQIDGASSWKIFWRIVLPSISPTSFYLLVMGVIGALQSFAVTNVLDSSGGPDGVGITVVFYLYRRVFEYVGQMGRASASAWILALIIMAITGIQFLVSKKWVSYD